MKWSVFFTEMKREIDSIMDEPITSDEISEQVPSKHPGLKKVSKKKRTELVKRARKGEDIGKPGKRFKEVAAKAGKFYGSKEAGKRVAAAAMWKQAAK